MAGVDAGGDDATLGGADADGAPVPDSGTSSDGDASAPDTGTASSSDAGDAADAGDGYAGPYWSTLTNFNAQGGQVTRFDTNGNAVDAHDGHIALFDGVYYLYGTAYGCGFVWRSAGAPFCGFKAYSSTDLVHWTDLGFLFDATTAVWQTRCDGSTYGCFRPHVVFNQATGKYVLWINTYDNSVEYRVFTSASPAGPFVEEAEPVLASTGAPGAVTNGDEGLFVDDDGTAYVAYTNWATGGRISIEQLDPTYLTGTGHQATGLTAGSTEAPAMFKRNGTYYVTYSDPNCGYCSGTGLSYVTATSPLGPWSAGTKINANSCGGQPSFVSTLTLPVGTTYLFGSDLWTGSGNEATANFYWAPFTFSANGAIDAVTCQDSVQVPTIMAGSQSPAPPGEDNSSGVDGFTAFCDIGAAIERSQSFTATRSGTLSSVSFTSFQSGNPTSGLQIDVYQTDSSLRPTGAALSSATVPPSSISWAPDNVTIAPNVPVVAGGHYAIVVHSSATSGCYGMAHRDASPYPGGAEAYSNNGGATFSVEPSRTLKFETVIGGAAADAGAGSDAGAAILTILDATYGPSCEAPNGTATAGNQTSALTSTCGGLRAPCTFPTSGTIAGVIGDPSFGCQKDWVAHYTCSGGAPKTLYLCGPPGAVTCEAGGLRATLTCP
jgi:hypothetical protein